MPKKKGFCYVKHTPSVPSTRLSWNSRSIRHGSTKTSWAPWGEHHRQHTAGRGILAKHCTPRPRTGPVVGLGTDREWISPRRERKRVPNSPLLLLQPHKDLNK